MLLVDYFDTVATRTVYPEYVKRLWAKRLTLSSGLDPRVVDLYQLRSQLEAQLCRQNADSGHDLEFRYGQLIEAMSDHWLAQGWSAEPPSLAACEALELQIECEVQVLRPELRRLLERAHHDQCRVVCVSDFYMPATFLKALLRHHGLEELVQDVYVSSEVLRTKASGRLYDHVLANEAVAASHCLMVGDNPTSDDRQARSRGIRAWTVARQHIDAANLRHRSLVDDPRRFADQLLHHRPSGLRFPATAASLYLFLERLHGQLMASRASNVYFLAREGQLLEQLFNEIQNRYHTAIRTHYVLVSRRATFLPSLHSLRDETFNTLFRQYRSISMASFLMSLGFESNEVDRLCRTLAIDPNCVEDDLPSSSAFLALVQDPAFRLAYEERRTTQRELLFSYGKQLGWDDGCEVHVVDVGWKGTIQDQLEKTFPRVRFRGHYLGLFRSAAGPRADKTGYLFSSDDESSWAFQTFNLNRALFEILLGADHPGVVGYQRGPDGTVSAVFEAHDPTANLFAVTIRPQQIALTAEFRRMATLLANSHFWMEDFEREVVLKHYRMLVLPSRPEIRFFLRLYHAENFGVFEVTRFSGRKVGMVRWLKNALSLLRSRRSWLEEGFWYPATFYSKGFGFLVPLIGWRRIQRQRRKVRP